MMRMPAWRYLDLVKPSLREFAALPGRGLRKGAAMKAGARLVQLTPTGLG